MTVIPKLLAQLLPPRGVELNRREIVRVFQDAGFTRSQARTAKNALFDYLNGRAVIKAKTPSPSLSKPDKKRQP